MQSLGMSNLRFYVKCDKISIVKNFYILVGKEERQHEINDGRKL